MNHSVPPADRKDELEVQNNTADMQESSAGGHNTSEINNNSSVGKRGSDDRQNKKRKSKKKRQLAVLVPLVLLVIMFFITLVLLAFHYDKFMPSDNVLYISRAKPGLRAGDDVQIWQNHTQVAIFRAYYENNEGVITVESALGNDIIAPGTENEYNFYLKNTSVSPISFQLHMNAYITVNGYEGVISSVPVNIKLRRYDGVYLIGGEDEWSKVMDLSGGVDAGAIGGNSMVRYTLVWEWEFENGNDEWDSFLGSASVDNSVMLTISIGASSDDAVPGTTPIGTSDCLCWLWIIIIILLIIALIVTLIILRRYMKLCEKYEKELEELKKKNGFESEDTIEEACKADGEIVSDVTESADTKKENTPDTGTDGESFNE